jgi:hypothetical protein
MSAATLPGDLSRYRTFQLGADLPAIAKQVGSTPAQAKVIQSRSALMQELEWMPRSLGLSAQTESAKEIVFSFYNGELFRIVVNYDRYETEGLTTDDFVEALSAAYGIAAKPATPAKAPSGLYGEQEEVIAQWQDPQYRFDLVRSSYGPTFKLVGVLKRLEAQAEAAILEAARLDKEEAPQREAAQAAQQEETERVRLEKARLVNQPKFRP